MKPLFRYVGGKSWMKEQLNTNLKILVKNHPEIKSYCEPFAGGLGSFLAVSDLLYHNGIREIHLNDSNKSLINFYQGVIEKFDEVFSKYCEIESGMLNTYPEGVFSLHKTNDKDKLKVLLKDSHDYYRDRRNEFNNSDHDPSLFLFLQRHCFNGMFRMNSKKEYNTPYCWEPKICDFNKRKQELQAFTNYLSKFNITFSSDSFDTISFNQDTFYYVDPPYANESLNEIKYSKDGFDKNQQLELISRLNGMKFIYSNHDLDFLIDAFKSPIEVNRVYRKNTFAGKKEARKQDKTEILVMSKI